MKITSIVYGRTTLPESMIFDGGDATAHRPIALRSYLIECEGRRILVDAGCDTMPGYVVTEHIGPREALRGVGLDPSDITDLIITHHHHDHTECARYFEGANIYIQREEYPLTKQHLPTNAAVTLFDEELCVCDGVKIIRVGAHTAGSCIVSVICDGREYIISGDECYHSDCLKYRIPTGSAVSRERAQAFVNEYSKDKYTVLVMHAEEIDKG